MKRLTLLALTLLACSTVAAAADVRGTYVEARNAEIYASHCFANSEMGLRGDLAVMGWAIDQGAWNGVQLDGLGVVAVLRASSTLGDPFNNPLPVKTALILDESATAEQRAALEAFVRHSAGALAENIVARQSAPIALALDGSIHAKNATLTAGDLVTVKTRAIHESDSLCHLDDLYYAPLVTLDHAMPAFAIDAGYQGDALGVTFNARHRSSAYLGTFQQSASVSTDD